MLRAHPGAAVDELEGRDTNLPTANTNSRFSHSETGSKPNVTAPDEGAFLYNFILHPASSFGKLLYASWESWYKGDQKT